MIRDEWTYIGSIDCFGLPEAERDQLFLAWHEECVATGGELQVCPGENSWDTDRFDVHIVIPGSPQPIVEALIRVAGTIDADHRDWVLQGFDRSNMQREDLVLRQGRLSRIPYVWQSGAAESLN